MEVSPEESKSRPKKGVFFAYLEETESRVKQGI
jgi:hypothetical protein